MSNVIKEMIYTIGLHRGQKRLYMQTLRLKEAGLTPGSFYEVEANSKEKSLVIRPSSIGYKVSEKKGEIPVIDFPKKFMEETFSENNSVRVTIFKDMVIITETHNDALNRKVIESRYYQLSSMEFFCGGGTLAKCVHDAGFKVTHAVELEPQYVENFEKNFPDTTVLCGKVQDITMDLLPFGSDLFVAGIPCDTYSVARRRGETAHDLTGKDLDERIAEHVNVATVYYVLEAIRLKRPHSVLIEEVVPFGKSIQCAILKSVLSDLGYDFKETVVAPEQELTTRRRYCLFASLKKGFEFPTMDYNVEESLGDIFFGGEPETEWFEEGSQTMKRETERAIMHKEKGNGFGYTTITVDSTKTGTFTKGYAKRRGEAYVHDGKRYRMAGKNEIRRVHGIPDDFVLPESYTTATEILGQGVLYRPFKHILDAIHGFLKGDSMDKLKNILMRLGYSSEKIESYIEKIGSGNIALITSRLEKMLPVA